METKKKGIIDDSKLQEHAASILKTFEEKEYDGKSLMIIFAYILARIIQQLAEQNSYPAAMQWFWDLTEVVLSIVTPRTQKG